MTTGSDTQIAGNKTVADWRALKFNADRQSRSQDVE